MVWGFVVVGEYVWTYQILQRSRFRLYLACFTMLVGLAMAEVCSAHPTSGGPYFWAAMLSEPENAAFASWVCGWFNLLGQVAVTTGIRFVSESSLKCVYLTVHLLAMLPRNLSPQLARSTPTSCHPPKRLLASTPQC